MVPENHWNQWSNGPKTIEELLMSMIIDHWKAFNEDGFLKKYIDTFDGLSKTIEICNSLFKII